MSSYQSKRRKSDIWKDYEKIDDKSAKCKHCLTIFKTSGNTSNLWDHLRRKHLRVLLEVDSNATSSAMTLYTEPDSDPDDGVSTEVSTIDDTEPGHQSGRINTSSRTSATKIKKSSIQPSITAAFHKATRFPLSGENHVAITDALMFMITKDCLPLDTTSGEGFKHFVRTIEPRYALPHPKTITLKLDDKFLAIKKQMMACIQTAEWFSLTSDLWTDSLNTRSYFGLTVHFIQGMEVGNSTVPALRCMIIAVKVMDVEHTSDNIQNVLEEIMLDWNLDKSKVVCCITDGAANIVKAMHTIFGRNRHLHCFAHLLNLMAKDSLNSIPEVVVLVQNVKRIVTYFKQSVNAADKLRLEQLRDGRPESEVLKLIQEVETRWNSTYYMLERFSTLHSAVVSVLSVSDGPSIISKPRLDEISEIVTMLKPVESVTREISAEKQVTISKLIPLIKCMKSAINQIQPKTQLAIQFKTKLVESCNNRFGAVEKNALLAIATLLDPRFKRIHFDNPLDCSKAVTSLNTQLKNYLPQQEIAQSTSQVATNDTIWSFHDALVASNGNKSDETDLMKISLRQYLHLAVIDRHDKPLEYWHSVAKVYPDLIYFAKKYLCVVGTSVPSERVFSKAGNTMTAKRNRLDPKRLEKLIILSNSSVSDWKRL